MNRVIATVLALVVAINGNFVHASAIGSPKTAHDQINANAYHMYAISFHGGQLAHVALRSAGQTFLTLAVFDKDGNMVAVATDRNGDAVASWVPQADAEYYIFVVNEADIANNYEIVTN
jgi:hypothetical protein